MKSPKWVWHVCDSLNVSPGLHSGTALQETLLQSNLWAQPFSHTWLVSVLFFVLFLYAFTGKQVYFLTINQSTQVRDPFVYVACNIILISILVNIQKQVLFSVYIYFLFSLYIFVPSEHLQQFRIVTHTEEICIQVLPCLV